MSCVDDILNVVGEKLADGYVTSWKRNASMIIAENRERGERERERGRSSFALF